MQPFISYAIWDRRTQAKKKNLIEVKNVINPFISNVSTAIFLKRHWFQLWVHIYNSE